MKREEDTLNGIAWSQGTQKNRRGANGHDERYPTTLQLKDALILSSSDHE
jgi:hypothetical protein